MKVRLRPVPTSAPGEKLRCPGVRRGGLHVGQICNELLLAGRITGPCQFTFLCPRCRNLIEVATVDSAAQTG